MKRGSSLPKERILELYGEIYPPQPKSNNYTLQQSRSDEIIFVLRESDETAPWIILEWIRENIHTAPEDKLRSAFEQALAMRKADDKRRAT
jgi:hypothetical protein